MSGKVATAEAMKMVVKRISLNKRLRPSVHDDGAPTEWLTHHSMVAVLFRPGRSLMKYAAGTTHTIVKSPKIRRHQAVPTFVIRNPSRRAITPPPSPPLACTIPFAKPFFLTKY